MADDKVEEVEEEIEVEVKDNTLKYIVILVAGIAIGLIVYKLFKDRKPEYHYMPYQGQVIHDNVEYHDLTKGQNIPQFRVPTTQNSVKNPLADIVNSQKQHENATMIVNGIPLNNRGEFVIPKHPVKYESVIIKRDMYTGEILDIIKTDDSMIR